MNVITAIDNYFIGENEGTISDRVWFYGTYLLTGAVFCATMIAL